MAVVNPDHLLDQADRLIAPPGGGAPRQTDLRRAISNAYYALFHIFLTEAADAFAGKTKRQSSTYQLVYRSTDHKSLRKLCEDVKKNTLPKKYSAYVPKSGFGSELVAAATAIVELQEKRHLADYDPLFHVSMSDAVAAVSTARTAISRFRKASNPQRKAFVALLVFSPR